MNLPRYTKNDLWIMIGVLIPWNVVVNFLIFGNKYFSSLGAFAAASVITFVIHSLSWQVHTWIAVTLKERFPNEKNDFTRLTFSIFLFILVFGLVTTLLFWGYDKAHFLGAQFYVANYRIALLIGSVINVFVTFLHEGVLRFEKWKATIVETEQLKKEYMQSQLLGLKSQINPHFLFNSLNSLSSLINEDEKEAEKFLDEMSKVYRYLLRNNEEELVPLKTELSFLHSYYYLLKVRHGKAIELIVNVQEEDIEKLIPPLTLQMLLEEVLNSNICSKDTPIIIEVASVAANCLEVKNNINRKNGNDIIHSLSLENITKKFRLLCQREVQVNEKEDQNSIRIPLLTENQMQVA